MNKALILIFCLFCFVACTKQTESKPKAYTLTAYGNNYWVYNNIEHTAAYRQSGKPYTTFIAGEYFVSSAGDSCIIPVPIRIVTSQLDTTTTICRIIFK